MYLTNGQAICLCPSVIAHRQSWLAQESSQPCYQASTSEKRPNGWAFGTLRNVAMIRGRDYHQYICSESSVWKKRTMSSIFKDIFWRRVSDNSNLCTQSLMIFLRKLWSSQPLSSTWVPVQKKYRCMQYISHTYYYILSVYLPSWHRPCTVLC